MLRLILRETGDTTLWLSHPPGAMNCAPTFLRETALLLVVLIVVDLCVIMVMPAIAVSLD